MPRLAFIGAGALLAALVLGQPYGDPTRLPPDAAAGPALAAAEPAVVPQEGPLAQTPGKPALPRVYLDTSAVPPSGRVITVPPVGRLEAVLNAARRVLGVPAGGRLQAALDAAGPGDVIELASGSTYVGNFVLPRKPGAEWITIRSSAYARLPPPGTRVAPVHARLMPKIISPNRAPAFSTAAKAHHYRLIGIEITTTSRANFSIVWLESPAQTSVDDVPTDIVIDRCYIHGTPSGNIRRGVALNGARLAVVDSYLSDFHERGQDSQAIMGWNGPGPFKIANNYLEGAGENVMFGGADPTIPNLVPGDIEIRGNHFVKPLSWRVGDRAYAGTRWTVKNLFELKNARRVLVDGNLFEQNWAQTQHGLAIVFTPRNQDGRAPWSTIEDVTFTHNIVRHSTGGFYLLGWDNLSSGSGQLQRVLIQNNLFEDIGAFPSPLPDAGVLFLIADGPAGLVIDHNTAIQTANPIRATTQVAGRWPAVDFVFTNNIARHNQSPRGAETPLATLQRYFPGFVFARNVLVGGDPSQYPPDNFFPASLDHVGFAGIAGSDYPLAASSPYAGAGTDGKDIGADITAIARAMPPALNAINRP
jgi:hypothetical protein